MKKIGCLLVFVLFLATGCSLPKITLFGEGEKPLKEFTLQGSGDKKILVMSIDGTISDRPQEHLLRTEPSIVQQAAAYLKQAEQDTDIKALLIKVNSPGGTVTASDILYHEISGYKQRTGAKVVVAMMNLAASGGYYISLPADYIMAHPTTITGSVGVIFMRPKAMGLMDKVGLSVMVNKSGPQKDMGSPFREATAEEQALFQGLTNDLAARFIGLVEQHRHLQPAQRELIATARIFLAEEALKAGLVDGIGYLDDAIAKTKSLAGLPENARVIIFRKEKKENDTIYNPAVRHAEGDLNALLPALAPLSAGSEADFYYVWPAAMGQ